MDPARQLGSMLGVLARYGVLNVQAAVRACRRGEATAAQQKMVAALLDAVADV